VSVEQVYESAVKQLGQRSQQSTISPQASKGTDHPAPIPEHKALQGVTVFLDRDGTLNPDPGYIRSPDQFALFPGVAEALAALKQAGAQLIVITNQSGIARGLFTVEALECIHDKLRRLLKATGASLDAVYFCPHHPDDGCRCRKPDTGMIDQAVRERQVDLTRSYFIGDHVRDMQLAKRIGARSILVRTGKEGANAESEVAAHHVIPDAVVPALTEAVEWILADARRRCQPSALSGQAGITSAEGLKAES
jgi:heptosyltransferase II